MQVSHELAPGLSHVPAWLYYAALSPVIPCFALSLLPAHVRQLVLTMPRFVPVGLAALVSLGWFVLAIYAAHAIVQHWRRHEPVYAAMDAWKLLVFAVCYYWAEGQIFPSLPAIEFAQVCFALGIMSQLFVLPILFDWFSRRYQHRTVA